MPVRVRSMEGLGVTLDLKPKCFVEMKCWAVGAGDNEMDFTLANGVEFCHCGADTGPRQTLVLAVGACDRERNERSISESCE